MEDKILCNVSDLEPFADAVREKEKTNKLYSVEELKTKVPELINFNNETFLVTGKLIASTSLVVITKDYYINLEDIPNIETKKVIILQINYAPNYNPTYVLIRNNTDENFVISTTSGITGFATSELNNYILKFSGSALNISELTYYAM